MRIKQLNRFIFRMKILLVIKTKNIYQNNSIITILLLFILRLDWCIAISIQLNYYKKITKRIKLLNYGFNIIFLMRFLAFKKITIILIIFTKNQVHLHPSKTIPKKAVSNLSRGFSTALHSNMRACISPKVYYRMGQLKMSKIQLSLLLKGTEYRNKLS